MRLHYLHKNLSTNVQFSVHTEKEFLRLWHYHPELELIYIVKGEGTLYAGDFIGNYTEDDIFILGKNVPHMFSSKSFAETQIISKACVFHINYSFLSSGFSTLPEFHFLQHILKISERGVMFREKRNKEILGYLENLDHNTPSENALMVFQLLLHLSNYKTFKSLGSLNWLDYFQISDLRITDVIEHIILHFREEIPLEKAAEISGMNKSAFCRYFRKNTCKTFISYLNEVRINYACKLLTENIPSGSISEACYKSGFNSLSYFNRTFKKVMGVCPTQYQSKINLPSNSRS
ncbi:AraC family transcriptional regulator [Antarcticibacterium sp. 1MA-6-2]|uniref:AraC family transcriptional regulator n=1 Tax=Antarcticibacterium sp. 1MA-6-2 TaxID=2908210 RepID=UPI001F2C0CF6|nr:AraC family transcriptional regulator [Antarcticibacterium sp. 1MA-6-2]UJH90703.1 AraC family transcriptional regulator [Antarcticibacterium sp. 1MA-6-2]